MKTKILLRNAMDNLTLGFQGKAFAKPSSYWFSLSSLCLNSKAKEIFDLHVIKLAKAQFSFVRDSKVVVINYSFMLSMQVVH